MQKYLDQLREQLRKLSERWIQVRDQALDVWGRLSERDRQLATVLGAFGAVVFVAVVVLLSASHLRHLQSDIKRRSTALSQIDDLKGEYRDLKARLDALNIRLKEGTAAAPKTFLEDKAREVNVLGSVDSMTERTAPPNDVFKASLIEVALKKISLANLTRYLYKIEAGNAGMTIHALDVKPNFADPKYLDATVQVMALRPKE